MDKKKLAQFLFYGTLFLMFAPLLNTLYPIIKERGLAGYYKKVKNPSISVNSWISSDYQKAKESYIKENFAFRNSLLRYQYQWMYSAYNMSRLPKFAGGKKGYVINKNYLNADLGKDYKGDKIDSIMYKLDVVYQRMKAEGKELLVVIAPSKSQYYQEFMPDSYTLNPNTKTNYKAYCQLLKNYNIPFIDANAWFLGMKDTTSYPLFPKTGIHYSTYGAAITADTMVQKWEELLKKDLPELYWDTIEWATKLRDEDRDVEWAMNLAFPISNFKMAYPLVKINEKGKYKPNILTVGDSFFWRFYRWKGPQKVYNNSEFLYYNREVYPGKTKRANYSLTQKMSNLDGICIYINIPGLQHFSWGFVEDLYEHYKYYDPQKIAVIIERMKSTPEWLAQEKEKAEKRGIDLEKMLFSDAMYFLRKQKDKKERRKKAIQLEQARQKKIRALMAKIKANKDWSASIGNKAKERGIPLDSMIYLDARYMILKKEQKK